MSRKILSVLFFLALAAFRGPQSIAQPFSGTVTFEHLPLSGSDTFYVNYSTPGQDVGFSDQNNFFHFPTVYDTSFGYEYWSTGFAYSNMTDSVTPGFGNQYAARPGIGHNGSAQYAIAYGQYNNIVSNSPGTRITGMYVTNTTYAYTSMLNGDGFSKKFGGTTGNDPDYFRLLVHYYSKDNGLIPGTDTFYLADFRSANNSQDYIVKNWTLFEFSNQSTTADSLVFELQSSDTGSFGINTPLYFALDDISYMGSTNVQTLVTADAAFRTYPNPVSNGFLYIHYTEGKWNQLRMRNAAGQVVYIATATGDRHSLDVSAWPAGLYLAEMTGADGTVFLKVVKP